MLLCIPYLFVLLLAVFSFLCIHSFVIYILHTVDSETRIRVASSIHRHTSRRYTQGFSMTIAMISSSWCSSNFRACNLLDCFLGATSPLSSNLLKIRWAVLVAICNLLAISLNCISMPSRCHTILQPISGEWGVLRSGSADCIPTAFEYRAFAIVCELIEITDTLSQGKGGVALQHKRWCNRYKRSGSSLLLTDLDK